MGKIIKLTCCILVFINSISINFFAQEKFEKEYRINVSEVPKSAVDLIENWNFSSKVKWFAEESNDGKSFEAKVKFKGSMHSIEFSENGTILDVEKEVKFSKLSKDVQQNIEKSLLKNFQKFSIQKVQIQFLGSESEIFNAVFKQTNTLENTNYEIELKGKKSDEYFMYEVLVTSDFVVKKELKFSSINALNLQF